MFAVLSALLVVGLFAAPSARADGEVVVGWSVSQDNGATFVVNAEVRNLTTATLGDWSVRLPFGHEIDDVSGAVSVQDGAFLILTGQRALAPGAGQHVSFTATSLAPVTRVPATCVTQGAACRIVLLDGDLPGATDAPSSDTPPESDKTPGPGTGSPKDDPSTEPPQDESPEPGSLSVRYNVTSDWASGQTVTVTVTNDGTSAITEWTVAVDAGVQVDSMWNAASTSGGGMLRAANSEWNGYLEPGQAAEFGFTAAPGGTPLDFSGCVATADNADADCSLEVSTATSHWEPYWSLIAGIPASA